MKFLLISVDPKEERKVVGTWDVENYEGMMDYLRSFPPLKNGLHYYEICVKIRNAY